MQRFSFPLIFCGIFALLSASGGLVRADLVTETIDGESWTTNKNFPLLGSDKAVKGGEFRYYVEFFVPTLRRVGPNTRRTTITDLYELTHEGLLDLHPQTLEFVPRIASHWRLSDDKLTYWFRIDPNARFSNGEGITAEDVVASYGMLVNPDMNDPSRYKLYTENFHNPEAISKYVVRIKAKKLNWRIFMYFAVTMRVYPNSVLEALPADVYLENYNWKMLPGSGPYIMKPEDLKHGSLMAVTRRDDHWGKALRSNRGRFNFDRIEFVTISDRELAYEKLKKGEIDLFKVMRSQRWAEDTSFDQASNGWVQKCKVYNQSPQGTQGFIFNMRTWPFNDKNVRQAFCYAVNRERLIEKLMFNQYDLIDSYWPGSEWGNPKNRKVRYNPRRAERFLERAGYTKRNSEGVRVHQDTGKALEFTLEYGSPSFTRILLVLTEDLMAVGIKMNLEQLDYNALQKKIGDRKFVIHQQAWRGIIFPNPFTSWHGDLADKTDNNNIAGFKSADADKLMEEYDRTFDRDRQIEIIREIDSLIFKEYPMCLQWYGPFHRLLWWNRFGMPDSVLSRTEDESSAYKTWWVDPTKAEALKKAQSAGSSLPLGPAEVDPWGVKTPTKQ